MSGTLSARYVWRLLESASAEGAKTADLAGKLGLREAPADDFGQRIAALAYLDLWDELVRRTDAGLPLRAAARFEPDFLVGFACMTTPTLRGALLGFLRWVDLLSDVLVWRLEEEADATVVSYVRPSAPHPGLAPSDEYNLALVLTVGRRFVGQQWAAKEARFVHAVADPKRYESFFGGAVRFGRPDVALAIPSAVLAEAPIQSHVQMATYFEKQLEDVRRAQGPTREPALVVGRLLRAELSSGPPSLTSVATRLGTSERTLRRVLTRAGTSYEKLLDGARRDAGVQLVERTNLRFDEVATLSGFSDATAFYKAFRRWTGATPGAYRTTRVRA